MIRRALAVICLFVLLSPTAASAQNAAIGASAAPVVEAAPSRSSIKATQIDDLIAGKLAADVDVASLFAVTLAGGDILRTDWVLRLVADGRLYEASRRDQAVLTGLTGDDAAFAIAQAQFLRLPAVRRAQLLQTHVAKRQKELAEKVAAKEKAGRIAKLEARIAGLRAFLAGRPALRSSLSIDLLDGDEVALDRDRRRMLLTVAAPPAPYSAAAPPDEVDTVAAAVAAIDDLRRQIIALPPKERTRLSAIQAAAWSTQGSETAALTEAGRQLAEARASSARAASEIDRLAGSERQKLLAVKLALATARIKLVIREAATTAVGENALAWRTKAADLKTRSMSDPRRSQDADRLYLDLIAALRTVRADLATALRQPVAAAGTVPVVPALDPILVNDNRGVALTRLRNGLIGEASELNARAERIGWQHRSALYDAMVEMNGTRLGLIGELSRRMRGQITGFDDQGLAQVQRELNQIVLTLRYHVAVASMRSRDFAGELLHPRSSLIFAVLQLLVIAIGFKFWHRRGDSVLASIEADQKARRPKTLMSAILALGVGILRKARRPIDGLLLLLVLAWWFPSALVVPGVRILWLILFWTLAAAALVHVIDAVAQGKRYDDPRAALRRKSLRLVLGIIVGVGLVLSLTDAAVGQGAMYSWVLGLCWLLMVPVVVLLARWWRERIDALADLGAARSGILGWSSRHRDGLAGELGRIAAGATLLFQGARSLVVRQINRLALIRDIAGQRARSKAAARVIADEASGRYLPIPIEQADRLAPHGRPLALHELSAQTAGQGSPGTLTSLIPGQIIAVVGERGLGKTTALENVHNAADGMRQVSVAAGTDGFTGLLLSLAEQLNCATTAKAVTTALAKQPHAIMIDDVQRLVVPAIGGLRGFDQLIAFARASAPHTAWAMAIGGPAWNYLERARADRALFDTVRVLPRWSTARIRGLIERRTAQACIEPMFDLDIHNAGMMLFDSDISPEERIRRQFFEDLTDYAAGNPAVALEFWRRSLFADRESGEVAVRTYKVPDTLALMTLPKTSLFALRAIFQMEVAVPATVIQSTDLSPVVVAEAIRILEQLGVVANTGNGHRISLFWYQDVRRLLERQNLIVRSVS